MINPGNKSVLIRRITALLGILVFFGACRKQEQVYVYTYNQPIPDATTRDTVISVTAIMNHDTFRALGRSLEPNGSINVSFYDLNGSGFLDIVLGADTPGTYTMGRSISANTAVYYKDALDKQNKSGFTSRATEEAGGVFVITEMDTITRRIKGTFHCLLLSRTRPDRFDFKEGNFNIQYNYGQMQLGDDILKATAVNENGLGNGTPDKPAPFMELSFPDSLSLMIHTFGTYKGPGSYTVKADEIILTDNKTGKQYKSVSGTAELIRYNYGEYMQGLFDVELKAADGATYKISNGIFVAGNTKQ
jgi:hypothetical protein